MKILVTGTAGFIGSHLAIRLLDRVDMKRLNNVKFFTKSANHKNYELEQ